MRITKVRIRDDQGIKKEVIFQRNKQYGTLLLDDHSTASDFSDGEQQEGKILALLRSKDKLQSIRLSLLNKTLEKQDKFNVKKEEDNTQYLRMKQRKNIYQQLRLLFSFMLDLTSNDKNFNHAELVNLKPDALAEFFSHKFQPKNSPLCYQDNGQTYQLNLIEELHAVLEKTSTLKEIKKALSGYGRWVSGYIKNKHKYLTHSIINNRIDINQNRSPRKAQLDSWGKELITTGQINHDSLAERFALQSLIDQWQIQWDQVSHQEGIPKDYFEFKRVLKQQLQHHQRALHQSGAFAEGGKDLSQYSLEVTKYLDRYFPLKKSARRLTVNDIRYYLTLETVKSIIVRQINNAVMQHLLQRGKAIHYGFEQYHALNSQHLREIKSQEAFALQLIDCCSFAANNLRNILDPQQQKDILGKADFRRSLQKYLKSDNKNLIYSRFRQFYGSQLDTGFQSSPQVFIDTIAAIRTSVQSIRNAVIHFKRDALKTIFSIETFESFNITGKPVVDDDNLPYVSEKIKLSQMFQKELDQLPVRFAEKLQSSTIFDYYPVSYVATVMTKGPLYDKPLAFIPGFKKVYHWAIKYLSDKQYPLDLNHRYFVLPEKVLQSGDVVIQPEQYAKINLLRFIYEHSFINAFIEDRQGLFTQAVKAVLNANRQNAKNRKNGQGRKVNDKAQAFAEISVYRGEGVADYLKSIQSTIITKENEQQEEGETGNFQKFLWQLFVKGFNDYLQKQTIPEPQWQFSEKQPTHNQLAQQRKCWGVEFAKQITELCKTTLINSGNNSHVAFWCMVKLLDARHINELSNQLSKWQQAPKSAVFQQQLTHIDSLQAILKLGLLNVDQVEGEWQKRYANENDWFIALQPYLSNSMDIGQLKQMALFSQRDSRGEAIPIIHAPIHLADKYATRQIMSALMQTDQTFLLGAEEIKQWQQQTNDAAQWSNERQALHQAWGKASDKKQWLKDNQTRYQALCRQLTNYEWLSNKVHFNHIRDLHYLLIDILARLAGYVALFERDFQFFAEETARIDANYTLSFAKNLPDIVKRERDKQTETFKLKPNQNDSLIFLYKNTFLCNLINEKNHNTDKYKSDRNYIAHLNYLTQAGLPQHSILDLFAMVRELVAYDRKLKNAVAQSLIDLLENHGVVIKFKPLHLNHHAFVIEKIETVQASHLGGKVNLSQRSDEYIKMVKNLLELKNN